MQVRQSGSLYLKTCCEFCDWVSSENPIDPYQARGRKARHMRVCHPECDIKLPTNLTPTTGNIRNVFEMPRSLNEVALSNGRANQPAEIAQANQLAAEVRFFEWLQEHENGKKKDKKNKQKKIK